jgi:hypothetical protein
MLDEYSQISQFDDQMAILKDVVHIGQNGHGIVLHNTSRPPIDAD